MTFYFTSKPTQYFTTLIYKCKLVGLAFVFLVALWLSFLYFQDFYFRRWQISCGLVRLVQTNGGNGTLFMASLSVLRPVHNTTLNNALRCVVFTSTLVETQHDARIDSDPILGFPCTACLRPVVKNPRIFLVINLCV